MLKSTDFPIGAVFEDNVPTFCGGGNSDTVHAECFKYNYTTNLWGNGTLGSIPSGNKNHLATRRGMTVESFHLAPTLTNVFFLGSSYLL